MLQLKNLIKKYGKVTILDNISYVFNSKKLYILKGENGSGKSTLLKIIAKLSYKTSGRIEGNNNVGYLHDKPVFPFLMRVDDYLKTIIKLSNKDVNYLDILDEYIIPNKRIIELSKGNKMKLGIAQVLCNDMDIYIFDEPLDGLDEAAKQLFKGKIMNLVYNEKIVILALHELSLFDNVNYTLLTLKDGKIYE